MEKPSKAARETHDWFPLSDEMRFQYGHFVIVKARHYWATYCWLSTSLSPSDWAGSGMDVWLREWWWGDGGWGGGQQPCRHLCYSPPPLYPPAPHTLSLPSTDGLRHWSELLMRLLHIRVQLKWDVWRARCVGRVGGCYKWRCEDGGNEWKSMGPRWSDEYNKQAARPGLPNNGCGYIIKGIC